MVVCSGWCDGSAESFLMNKWRISVVQREQQDLLALSRKATARLEGTLALPTSSDMCPPIL